MTPRNPSRMSAPRRILASFLLGTTILGPGVAAYAQTSSFTPIHPPAAALVTRGPYLNVWLKNASGILPGTWPQHWARTIKALTGIAYIDGKPFLFLGAPSLTPSIPSMTQTSLQTTATQAIFTLNASGVNLTVDFLSPVEATDLKRLSMPLSDIDVSVASADGASHTVSVYFDISAEWASGNETAYVNWAPETIPLGSGAGSPLSVWTVKPTHPTVFQQTGNFADWGTVLWAAQSADGLTTQSGQDIVVRGQFAANGVLANTDDTNQPRAINNEFPVFAFAKAFGTVGTKPTKPFTLLIGRVRTPAINYLGTSLNSLWTKYFSSYKAMLAFAYNDAAAALTRANKLDANLANASAAIGGAHYAALTALTLRQAFAGTELVGTTKNPYFMLEEISSDDNVQTVDVIYPSMPAFLYTNPELVRDLIEPVIDYVESGQWPEPYAPHDLGQLYPNASGHNDGGGENMPVEETANMLIMADAYMQHVSASEAAAYANAHYTTFRNWANYLLTVPPGVTYSNAVDPQYQNQTDDFAGLVAHSVNLALKGISGVAAMGQIAAIAGVTGDSTYYRNAAQSGIQTWASLSQNTAGNHLLLTYREAANQYSPSTLDEPDGDYSLKYNSFPNRLLGLDLIPDYILTEEAAYDRTIEDPTGIILQTGQINGNDTSFTKADWELWTAAGLGDPTLEQNLIDEVYDYANTTQSGNPFPDLYDPNGTFNEFEARPVMGGAFAPLLVGGGGAVGGAGPPPRPRRGPQAPDPVSGGTAATPNPARSSAFSAPNPGAAPIRGRRKPTSQTRVIRPPSSSITRSASSSASSTSCVTSSAAQPCRSHSSPTRRCILSRVSASSAPSGSSSSNSSGARTSARASPPRRPTPAPATPPPGARAPPRRAPPPPDAARRRRARSPRSATPDATAAAAAPGTPPRDAAASRSSPRSACPARPACAAASSFPTRSCR